MPRPFFFVMVTLQPITPSQQFYCTWFEARKYLPTFTHYLMTITGVDYATQAIVPIIVADNNRYTVVEIDTDAVSLTGVLLERAGQYEYKVYGQNSATNLDPTDASVVGEVETGVLLIVDTNTYVTTNNPTTPPDYIYYE